VTDRKKGFQNTQEEEEEEEKREKREQFTHSSFV